MYLNTFINLEENINGYGKNQKNPSGHVIICMPGMVRVYLQNLRNLQGKEYICYGLSKNDNKAVRLGAINTSDENKMTNFKIDINNIQGKGIKANNLDCIAIVIEGDTVGNTDTVMVGYVNDKYLITPILEKGLPKKEVKVTPESTPAQLVKNSKEERKDKTPSPKVVKSTVEEEKALNTNVITPIQSEESLAIEGPEIAKKIIQEKKALNTDVITPIQSEETLSTENVEPAKPGPGPVILPTPELGPGPVKPNKPAKPGPGPVVLPTPELGPGSVKPNEPAKPGPGPVILPTPELGPGPVKPNEPAKPGPGPVVLPTPELGPGPVKPNEPAKPGPGPVILPTPELGPETAEPNKPAKKPCMCGCGCESKKENKDLSKQIKEIIEALDRNDGHENNLQKNIQSKLDELLEQGVSRHDILSKKDELEEQIKRLVGHKIVNEQKTSQSKEEKQDQGIERDDLENRLRTVLDEQFDVGYSADRGCKSCKKPVEIIKDKDENFYEKETLPEKQGSNSGETSKEEVDFLEQLEVKLKSLQQLLKTTIAGDVQDNNVKENDKSKKVETGKEKSVKPDKVECEKKNVIDKKEEATRKEEYDRVREIFETSVKINPFENDNQPIDWVRISLAELISIPQLKYDWATQPFITFSYHKFNHLILGKDREVEQYYLGIPDIYHQTRGHILEIDKIERFVGRNADKLSTGDPGYWIAMI